VEVNVQNVPQPLIQFAVAQIKTAAEQGLRNADDQQKQLVTAQMEQLEEVLKEFDSLTIGYALDSKERTMYLEADMTVIEGGKLSKQIAGAMKAGKATKLAGLADEEAVVNFHFSSPVMGEDKKSLLQALDAGRQQAAEKIKEIEDATLRQVVEGMA